MNCIGQFIISAALGPRVQLLRYGFDSRHRHVGWWSFWVRQTQRHGIGTVDVFDLLVRITCIFSPVVGKVSHSRKQRMFYCQLARIGRVVGIGPVGRIGPVLCLT